MTIAANKPDYSSTTVPRIALFVAADEKLLVYSSAMAAEDDLEAVDVENGEYPAAYGPNGEAYCIGSDGNRVIIERTFEPDRPGELKDLLLRYLEAIGRPGDATAPLESLVAEVWKIKSDFWGEHDPDAGPFGSRVAFFGCLTFVLGLVAVLFIWFN